MMKRFEKELLKLVAKCSDSMIIINIPTCPFILHQPKRPDSLRRVSDSKKKTR